MQVQGSEFRVQGSGFRVQGSGFRVKGLEARNLSGVFGLLERGLLLHLRLQTQNIRTSRLSIENSLAEHLDQ